MMEKKKMAVKKIKRKAMPDTPVMTEFPSVRKGSKETGYITMLQTILKNRGYDVGEEGVDGKFGPKTEKAVKEFQKDLGYSIPNGIVGPKMWKALQESKVVRITKAAPAEHPITETAAPVTPVSVSTAPATKHRVLIDGLTKYQAELLVMLLKGSTDCRIL